MRKQPFRVLYREFLFRMVDLEVLSAQAQGDANKLLGRFAALLVFVSVWMALGAFGYATARMVPVAALAAEMVTSQFLIASTMLVVGLFAVLSWDSTFPDRRDVLVLAPLPVRARTMFLAKVAAVGTALGLSIGLLHGAMGLIWPFAFAAHAQPVTIPALTADPTPSPVSAAGLQSVLTRDLAHWLNQGRFAPGAGGGLTIGVWKHGESRVFSYGAAQPDSLYEIGSITKTFTSLILARMVVQGKVALDEPIRLLLPPGLVSKPEGDEIRLLDIATQHSDLPRTVDGDWQDFFRKHGVRRLPEPPFQYSNFAFGVMGQLLALHEGLTYSELLQREIAGPLGLNDTVVPLDAGQQERFLQGYGASGEPVAPAAAGLAGSGAIRSTASDLLKYLVANMHPESLPGTLPQAMALAHRPRAQGPPGTFIGLAWFYSPEEGTWGHGGARTGFTSNAFFCPGGDYAAVVLLNNGPDIASLADLLGSHIQQRLSGEPAVSLDTTFVPASSNRLRWFGGYWFTIIASAVFIYCGVLSVQGIAAQLLPRRLFLRASGLLQMAAFFLFVGGYFLQPIFGELTDLASSSFQRTLIWLPPYWFLALFQRLNGSPYAMLDPLAGRAWTGLGVVVTAAAISYALSYLRTLRQIVEQPDITPGVRRLDWLPPFGGLRQTAIAQFTIRTLARSRQHRMILAFYLGIGFAYTTYLMRAPSMKTPVPGGMSVPVMAASLVMLVLAVVGTRVVFALPLDLRANWIFRVTGLPPGNVSLVATRRAMLLISLAPVCLVTAIYCFWFWPWQLAAGHVALLWLVGMTVADLRLYNFRKIPFTCSYLPGKSQVHLVILGALGLMYFILISVRFERAMFLQLRGAISLLAPFALAAVAVRLWTRAANSEEEDLQFEDTMEPAVIELGLHRDGVMPTGAATR